jgi:regulator of RNase E activity RraA
MWYDVPAEFAGVRINSGDLVFADMDGIVFVPSQIMQDVVAKALEKTVAETTVRQELLDGSSLSDVFERHGIL